MSIIPTPDVPAQQPLGPGDHQLLVQLGRNQVDRAIRVALLARWTTPTWSGRRSSTATVYPPETSGPCATMRTPRSGTCAGCSATSGHS